MSQKKPYVTVGYPAASESTNATVPNKIYQAQAYPAQAEAGIVFTYVNEPKLYNVVATVDLSQYHLDLIKISSQVKNTYYNSHRFPAVIIRKNDPKTTGLIFATGKMIIIGAKSIDVSKLSARKFAKDISKALSYEITFDDKDFRVRNMVANCSMPFYINRDDIENHDVHAKYSHRDDHFPGTIYRMLNVGQRSSDAQAQLNGAYYADGGGAAGKTDADYIAPPQRGAGKKKKKTSSGIVALIFSSGKIVFTGAQSEYDIKKAYEYMYAILPYFRKKNVEYKDKK